nr:zinc finger, CCHC-type [Tanacetum cinerariifolium]
MNNKNKYNLKGGNTTHKGNSNRNKGEWDLSKVRCFKCQKLGHYKKDCRGTSTTREQSNLILEDDEPSLLMTTHETEHEEVLLNEGQIQPEIYATADASMWYLDNGASNHMMGIKSHFRDIDESVTGRIRFGDGSHVERSKNRLYSTRLQIEAPICLLTNIDNQAWLWHARLGHLNFDDINKMTKKGLVEGIPRINHAGRICNACLLGKHSRTPFPNQAKFRSKNPLDLVYGDLCGPISPATHSGKKFIFLLVDDCTRFMWAYFRTSKDHTFSTFKEFRQRIEMEMRMKLRMLRTDRGCEFTSNEFTKYCKENEIARLLTTPYSPQQNRVVERRNRIVLSTTRRVDNKNATPVNTKINENITYHEHDPITDPDSPVTPPAYTYNPNSEEEEEATISSLRSSEDRFDDTPVQEPRNYKEASTDKKWIEAMGIELDSINKNNIWTLTTLPINQKAIGLKWVYKAKRDAKGKIIKYKARLVEKGYVQEQGIDFDEIFALVAWIKTVRLILALPAYHGCMMESNDTKIPMDPGTKLVKAEDGNSVNATYYRSLIGSLRYLLHTRPDLSYSVGLLSIFMQDPKDHHLKAVKQVIRYIKGTKEHGIIYKKEGGCRIIASNIQPGLRFECALKGKMAEKTTFIHRHGE